MMSEYKIYDISKVHVGYIKLASYNCKQYSYIGTDLSNNKILYNPNFHTIESNDCDDKLSNQQCTAWKNFYKKIKNSNIQKECPDLETNPCISCSPVTCTGGNITNYYSTVEGINFSLIDLSKFSRLKNLNIHNPTDDNKKINITGNFSDLSSLQQLEGLVISSLDKTNIIGNLEDLVYNKNLNTLVISGIESNKPSINLTGNLNNLAKLHKLQDIVLHSKNITGNLNDISGLSHLDLLDLQYSSNISGNLNILNNFKKINTINIPLVKNGLDGSCNDISNILRTMGADACALNVKDYDNCIKDYSSYCTFINPKEQSICKSISSSKKLSQYCTSVTISHECATSLIPNTICFYWDKTTKTYECTPAGLGNPSCPNSSLDGSSGILCNCSDFGSITIPSD